MNGTYTPTPDDVAAFEHATWSRCASNYHDGFSVLTGEATGPLLDAVGVGPDSRVLDVGTGTGDVAVGAAERGASVVGIDFSQAMLAEARRLHPEQSFREGSVESLPFTDESFDAVVGNTVLHHLGDPVGALREAHRVLAPSGRVAFTIWAEPESLEAFGLFLGPVAAHAGEADLPHGPLFGVTDSEQLSGLFREACFVDVTVSTLPTVWRMQSIDELLRAFGTWAQLDTFPDTTRKAIEEDVRRAAASYESGDGLAVPNPMLLITGRKPA